VILTFFGGRIEVMSTILSHLPLKISETVRYRGLVLKRRPIENGLWGIKWSRYQ